MEALCTELHLDVSDRRILLLAWKTAAQRMGFFEQQEWLAGAWVYR